MPLSEYEQRVLEQLERDLGADPKLGKTLAQGPRHRGRLVIAVLGVIVGLAVVLTGVMANIVPLGIAGFALMIGAAMWAILAPSDAKRTVAGKPGGAKKARSKESLTRRAEDRIDRRRERGDL